jgi:hypothetical protein
MKSKNRLKRNQSPFILASGPKRATPFPKMANSENVTRAIERTD